MQTKRNAFTFALLLFLGGTLSPIKEGSLAWQYLNEPGVSPWCKEIVLVQAEFHRERVQSGEVSVVDYYEVGKKERLPRALAGLARLQQIAQESHDGIAAKISDRTYFVNVYLLGLEELSYSACQGSSQREVRVFQELWQAAGGEESPHLDVIASFYPSKVEQVKGMLRSAMRGALTGDRDRLLALGENCLSRTEDSI